MTPNQIILKQLMKKKGIYAYAAKIYMNDEEKSRQLIFECYDQCHVQGAIDDWGIKLVNEIKAFCELHDKNIKKPSFAIDIEKIKQELKKLKR